MRGFASAILALVVLEVLVTSSADRVGGLLGVPAGIARRFLDPSVPAIPDLRKSGGAGTKTSATTTDSGSSSPPTPIPAAGTSGPVAYV